MRRRCCCCTLLYAPGDVLSEDELLARRMQARPCRAPDRPRMPWHLFPAWAAPRGTRMRDLVSRPRRRIHVVTTPPHRRRRTHCSRQFTCRRSCRQSLEIWSSCQVLVPTYGLPSWPLPLPCVLVDLFYGPAFPCIAPRTSVPPRDAGGAGMRD